MTASLEEVLVTRLQQQGGVVIERLINRMRSEYSKEAPELATIDDFKSYIESKPDLFRISTSVNGVERARLTNPRRITRGLLTLATRSLEEMDATDEDKAVSIDQLLAKAQEAKRAQLQEDEEMPYDLADKDEFVTSMQRARGVHFVGDSVYVSPRSFSKGRTGAFSRGGEANENDATAANGDAPGADASRRRRSNRGARGKERVPPAAADEQTEEDGAGQRRRIRPQGTPKEPQPVELAADVNDSTLIAQTIYKKLCERGAINIDVGLTTKMLLRVVSLDFKEARPDAECTAMNSLRVFKALLAHVPGLKRQRPRTGPPRTSGRGPRPPLEQIVWIENEDEIVAGLRAGLADDLANADVTPDMLEDPEGLENGQVQQVNVFDQESWNTAVVGPTSKESVLQKFLKDHDEQAIWAIETEHRVGLRNKPAGNIAIIVLSDMHNTIIWDVHQGGFPQCLKDFFLNEGKFKGGVRIGPKGSKLKKQFGVAPVQLAELSIIAHTLGFIDEDEKERVSMRMMTQKVLGTQVSRPPPVRDSNWELRPLTKAQYKYAVEDGFATALLFMQMVAQLHKSSQGHKLNEACISVE